MVCCCRLEWLYFLLLLVAFELVADILAKQFALNGKLVFALLSITGFIAANIAWIVSLRTGAELGKGAVLFSVLSRYRGSGHRHSCVS